MLTSLLNRDIEIWQPGTATTNAVGEKESTDVLYKRKRAGVKYLSGTEASETSQKTVKTTIRFQVRYDATLTEQMKIKYMGNLYDINTIEPHFELNQQYQFVTASKISK